MGGDAATVRCSLLALATAVYEFSAFVPDLTLEDLLDKVSKLATCSSREVVGSCLSFVAVFIQVRIEFVAASKFKINFKHNFVSLDGLV